MELPFNSSPALAQPEALAEVAALLVAVPGVTGVALATSIPLRGYTGVGVFLRDQDSGPGRPPVVSASHNRVAPEFFAVTGARIVEGRAFTQGEQSVVVVDEAMARAYWPGESPVGKCLVIGNPEGACHDVIGVVEDQRRTRIIGEPTAQYLLPLAGALPRTIVFRVDSRGGPGVLDAVRDEVYRFFDPGSVRVARMSDALEPQFRPWRLGAQLFTAFGVLALIVTVVGVYGVTAYAVSQRTHEMGVRIALGARLKDLLRLVLGEGLQVVTLGVLLGVAISLALGRLVEPLLYGVTPRDPTATFGAVAVLLAASVAASLVPAWRAGQVDPCEALRQE